MAAECWIAEAEAELPIARRESLNVVERVAIQAAARWPIMESVRTLPVRGSAGSFGPKVVALAAHLRGRHSLPAATARLRRHTVAARTGELLVSRRRLIGRGNEG